MIEKRISWTILENEIICVGEQRGGKKKGVLNCREKKKFGAKNIVVEKILSFGKTTNLRWRTRWKIILNFRKKNSFFIGEDSSEKFTLKSGKREIYTGGHNSDDKKAVLAKRNNLYQKTECWKTYIRFLYIGERSGRRKLILNFGRIDNFDRNARIFENYFGISHAIKTSWKEQIYSKIHAEF